MFIETKLSGGNNVFENEDERAILEKQIAEALTDQIKDLVEIDERMAAMVDMNEQVFDGIVLIFKVKDDIDLDDLHNTLEESI